jgi:hypothetical protein
VRISPLLFISDLIKLCILTSASLVIRVLDVREVSYPDSSSSDSSDDLDMAVTLLMAMLRLQKRPIAVRGCTDRCKRKGGGESATSESMVEQ